MWTINAFQIVVVKEQEMYSKLCALYTIRKQVGMDAEKDVSLVSLILSGMVSYSFLQPY